MPKSGVYGHKQTARSLRRLGRSMRRPVGEASRKALQPVLADAKSNLRANNSYKRGVLFKSMKIRRLKSSGAKITWTVSATGKGVGIAHLVEFGTEPHWQPKRGRMHPGARPFPFLTPAFIDNDDLAIRIFGQEIGPAIELQALRLASRS